MWIQPSNRRDSDRNHLYCTYQCESHNQIQGILTEKTFVMHLSIWINHQTQGILTENICQSPPWWYDHSVRILYFYHFNVRIISEIKLLLSEFPVTSGHIWQTDPCQSPVGYLGIHFTRCMIHLNLLF